MKLMLVAVQVTSDRSGDRKSYLRPSVQSVAKARGYQHSIRGQEPHALHIVLHRLAGLVLHLPIIQI